MNNPDDDFELSSNQHDGPKGTTRQYYSETRERMIAFALAHRGKWVTYRPHPDRDNASLYSLRSWAYRGYGGGFTGGRGNWQVSLNIARGSMDLRYIGPEIET